MSDAALGALSFVILLALMALRMPIGLAMFVVGAVGYVMLNNPARNPAPSVDPSKIKGVEAIPGSSQPRRYASG